jgi:predicted acylesterase/phospholipase RssA
MDNDRGPTGPDLENMQVIGVRELRLAVSFSGGVSLAVWMGGVAHELSRLCASSPLQRAEPACGFYQDLLGLTRSTPSVDVLAGTSAGGINGAALALALARGGDVAPLREVWLEHGDLDALLRPVTEVSPPSLLRGDQHLGAHLRRTLHSIADRADPSRAVPWAARVRLTITTTLTDAFGDPAWTDALGEPIGVNQHLGLMRFDHPALCSDGAADRLAVAARASASYPGGFEPASVPTGHDENDEPEFPRPSLSDVAQWSGSAWGLDGGLLLNEPLDPILADVIGQPSGSEIRRLLLRITPAPGAPRPPVIQRDRPLSLLGTLWAAREIPSQQHLGRELRRLDAHNRSVERRRELRAALLSADIDVTEEARWDDDRIEQAAIAVLELVVRIHDRLLHEVRSRPRPSTPDERERLRLLGADRAQATEVIRHCRSGRSLDHGALAAALASIAVRTGAVGDDVDAVRRRLLATATLTATAGEIDGLAEQRLDIVQVSARGWCGIGRTGLVPPPRSASVLPPPELIAPERKLRGLDLARFSAFYKRSWRANDWMWGRIDIAYHLCRVLLEPGRLRQLYGERWATERIAVLAELTDRLRAIAVPPDPVWREVLSDEHLPAPQQWEPVVRQELTALLDGRAEHLHWTPCWVARRAQLEIIAAELPSVADAIGHDARAGANVSDAADELRRFVGRSDQSLDPARALAAMRLYRVHEESFDAEKGAPLGIALATRTTAVGIAALEGERGGLPRPLRRFFALRPMAAAVGTFADARRTGSTRWAAAWRAFRALR